MTDPFIQIAGIKDKEEAELVCRAGARYLGFPLRLDRHKPDLSEDAAASIIRGLPLKTVAVLITYLADAKEILLLCQALKGTVRGD